MEAFEIARVAHEVNRAYCQAIGDDSQPPWETAPDWQKKSAEEGVTAHINKPLSPEESHQAWLDHKEADGWTYGPIKDVEKKQHPCAIPYAGLPFEQKVKDYLFAAIVAALK